MRTALIIIIAVVVLFILSMALGMRLAKASTGQASWYGPGLYGNPMACGGVLTTKTWAVANRHLPCGSRVRLCYHGRCVTATVRDRGPFVWGREFDLTWPVAHALCLCRSWGVRSLRWTR